MNVFRMLHDGVTAWRYWSTINHNPITENILRASHESASSSGWHTWEPDSNTQPREQWGDGNKYVLVRSNVEQIKGKTFTFTDENQTHTTSINQIESIV